MSLRVIFIASLLFCSHARGQAPKAIEDVLKEYGAAEPTCQKPKADPSSAAAAKVSLAPVPGAAASRRCLLDYESLEQAVSDGRLVVDVRPPREFSQFHIEGSVSFSPGELKTKTYLKEREIVLLGTGKDGRLASDACMQLTAAGFIHVKALRGGMLSWVRHGGAKITGTPPSVTDLAQLSAAELFQETVTPENTLIILDDSKPMRALLPAHAIPIHAADAKLIKVLQGGARRSGNVVLITRSGHDADFYAKAARATAPRPLLIYAGSADAFSSYLATQKAIWTARERPPRQPHCSQ